ncbi:MAG: alpha-galactosidase [Mogibacterium sp.]|nr:alpha-galactosidase [Mogibacterium sp.]
MKEFDLTPLIKRRSVSEIVLDLPCDETERVFFNGYQTWSPSHEEKPSIAVRTIHPLVKAMGRPWGTSRYGDGFFIRTEHDRPGMFHGFSYFYKRYEEEYLLIASTDETNGYTIFRYDFFKSELSIKKDAGMPKYDQALHIVAFRGGYDEVFDAWFEAAGIKRRPAEPLAGYGSWYNRFTKITDETITADLEGCAKVLEPGDLFQIDDGWQVAVGDWTAHPVKFPRGMRASVDDIHEKGFKAGLWLAPFGAQADSQLVRDHPDWLLKHDGKPWYAGSNWGGFYSLDMDIPEVRDHLRGVFDAIFNDWGFDLVKLDFLYAAAPWMTKSGPFFGESRGARMCRAMDYLREWCGNGMILGCGVPLMPAFGKVEYCRIGPDASLEWDGTFIQRNASLEYPSTKNAILDTFYRRGLDGRAFLNDPDVFFLRKDNIKLTEEQKDMHARVLAQYGSFFLTSDNMGDYDEEQTAHYKELRKVWTDKSFTSKKFLKGLKD